MSRRHAPTPDDLAWNDADEWKAALSHGGGYDPGEMTEGDAEAELADWPPNLPRVLGCQHTDDDTCRKCGAVIRWGSQEVPW